MNNLKGTFIGFVTIIFSFGIAAPLAANDVVTKGTRVTTRDMITSNPLPPTDIYRPRGRLDIFRPRGKMDNFRLRGRKGPKHEDLATFAWLEFIALAAPVGAVRGEPGGSFADSGMDQFATLVWETYQHRSELFPYTDGTVNPPQPWNDPPLYQFYIGPKDAKTAYQTPAELTRYGNLDEATQIGQNAIFFPELTDDGDDTDQQLDQVLFEAKVNEVQSAFVRDRVENNLTDPIVLDDNTIEVKAAWLPLTAIPEDQWYRYHIAEVTVYGGEDDAPVAVTEVRALIGLHIIQKTPNYPAFIFATFEHTDLLQDPETDEPTKVAYVPIYDEIAYQTPLKTTLHGIQGTPEVFNPLINFQIDDPLARPNGNILELPLGPVENLPGRMLIDNNQVLVPVVQPDTTNKDVDKANKTALKAMTKIKGFDDDFVWQYYKLKGVQGVPSNNETKEDFYLANIVIESSQPGVQVFRGGLNMTTDDKKIVTFNNVRNQTNLVDSAQNNRKFSQGGCQGCHGVAQTQAGSDFSFLFAGKNGKGFHVDTSGVKTQDAMLERLKRYSLLFSN